MTGLKKRPQKPDFILLFSALAILAVGLIMVLSASSLFSYENTSSSYSLFFKQLKLAGFGLFTAIIVSFLPYKYWKKFSGLGVIVSIFLLILVRYSDMSDTIKGSARWLNIAGITVQPSEIAKLALVVFFAYILSRYPVKTGKDALVAIIVLGVVSWLVYKQPDLGTTIVIALTCLAMLLQTELSLLYFLVSAPIVGFCGYYLVRRNEYQWNRILGWLDPWGYASSFGYQGVNAQIALATGGLFGIGIGRSYQVFGYLPENYTDTIFAVIGEEFGFLGSLIILLLYAVMISRGYIISKESPDCFGRMLGFGLTSMIAIQTVVNMSVVTGLCPVTGITLPLVSYGGSSLIITMVEVAILLNISRFKQKSNT
ncbi:MAG: putative peptidoglycan glycosyltransferase FtsW [Eubacteriales bacterium]